MLAVAALRAQSTNGAVYWDTSPPDCSGLQAPFNTPVSFAGPSGASVYACEVSGTFVWLAAGGEWSTAIHIAAPASNPVGVAYTFYDQNGSSLSLDTNMGSGTATSTGNGVNFALSANQPAEVDLLGAGGGGPSYTATQTGSVYAEIYCPDETTCENVTPQLIYSALPSVPWSLSVPLALDCCASTQWSAEGIDDGSQHLVSFVVYNDNSSAATYTIDIYDSAGTLVTSATTPSIPGANSTTGEAGTYAVLLHDLVPNLPSGIFKILLDGGASNLSAFEVLQFNGQSGTALEVAYDTAPGGGTPGALTRRPKVARRHAAAPKRVFPPLANLPK